MALPTLAGLLVRHGFGVVAVEAILAVVAVASVRVVAAVQTDSPARPTRQLVELHVEATLARVLVTVARCTHAPHLPKSYQYRH